MPVIPLVWPLSWSSRQNPAGIFEKIPPLFCHSMLPCKHPVGYSETALPNDLHGKVDIEVSHVTEAQLSVTCIRNISDYSNTEIM